MQMSNDFDFLLFELILKSSLIRVEKNSYIQKSLTNVGETSMTYTKYNHVQVSFIRYIIPALWYILYIVVMLH
jgi:hypothetical protein